MLLKLNLLCPIFPMHICVVDWKFIFQVDLKRICPICHVTCENIHLTAKHVSTEHEHVVGFSVTCIYCSKVFLQCKKWKRHVIEVHSVSHDQQRVHFDQKDTQRKLASTCQTTLSGSSLYVVDDAAPGPSSSSSVTVEQESHCVDVHELQHPADFLLDLKTTGLSDKHCDSLVDYFGKFAHNVAGECVRSIARDGHVNISTLPSLKSLEAARSSCALNLHASRNLLCVSPHQVSLGKTKNGKLLSYQYISLTKQLQNLFVSKRFEGSHLLQPKSLSKSGVYRDIFDGVCHQSLENQLSLIVFFDEFVVACPIGSHANQYKLGAVYCCIANLSEERTHSDNTLLLLLFHSKYLKKHSWSSILKPLLDEIVSLERDGTQVVYRGQRISVSVRVEFTCGDNLGIHSIAGFFASFSNTNRLCRFCYASAVDIKSCFNVEEFRPRTQELYDRELEVLEANQFSKVHCKRFGIRFPCPFRALKKFHVADFFPFDIVHDLFEGVVKYAISLVLTAGIHQSRVNLNALNGVIGTFAFSPLEDNKPVPLQRSGSSVSVGGTASETWTLLRLLPILLTEANSDLVDAPEFKVITQLISIVQYAVSPALCEADLVVFERLIKNWLILVNHTFQDFELTPKFHYLLHYPDQIRKHGPLRCSWTMRFEAKHQQLKSCLARSKNSRNVCKTIAGRHQRIIAVRHSTTGNSAVSSAKPFRGKEKVDFPLAVLSLAHGNVQCLWKSVKYRNTVYIAGQVVIVKRGENTAFCEILSIVVEDGDVGFILRYLDDAEIPDLSCVEVRRRDEFVRVRPDCLADYLPLAMYVIGQKRLVVLKHKRPSLGVL